MYDKIKREKLQLILTEEQQKHSNQVKINYTIYCCIKIVKLDYPNYFFGISC